MPHSDERVWCVGFRVHGKVQGVFFRASTKQKAKELGLAGWVRNCTDGSVQAAAQGPREALEEMVEWARTGPEHANVTSLDIEREFETIDASQVAADFQIRSSAY